MVQIRNVLSHVNTNTLRPIYHRFLTSKARHCKIETLYRSGLPPSALLTFEKVHQLLLPSSDNLQMYIQRIVPLEQTHLNVSGIPYAVLCVARENTLGGEIITKTTTTDLLPGVLATFDNDALSFHIRQLQPINIFEDSYMDVVWFISPL